MAIYSIDNSAAELAFSFASLQISALAQLAAKVFGNELVAQEWLSQRNLALDDRRPVNLLTTEDGKERVRTLLMQIEYGVLA